MRTGHWDWRDCARRRVDGFYFGDHLLETYSSTQQIVALSTAESECISITKGAAHASEVRSAMAEFGLTFNVVCETDASAGRAMVTRRGLGRVRHLGARLLWLQQLCAEGVVRVRARPGELNEADIRHAAWLPSFLFFRSFLSSVPSFFRSSCFRSSCFRSSCFRSSCFRSSCFRLLASVLLASVLLASVLLASVLLASVLLSSVLSFFRSSFFPFFFLRSPFFRSPFVFLRSSLLRFFLKKNVFVFFFILFSFFFILLSFFLCPENSSASSCETLTTLHLPSGTLGQPSKVCSTVPSPNNNLQLPSRDLK